MSPKKWPLAQKRKFFWGWSEWESCSPWCTGYMPPSTKIAITIQKIDFWPQISNFFGSKKHIFAPSGQLEPHRSMFSTQKRGLIGLPIWGYQNFYSLPPKDWIFCLKTAKFGPKLAFSAKYRHFWPIWSKAWPKNNADKLSRWFLLCWYQNFYLLP